MCIGSVQLRRPEKMTDSYPVLLKTIPSYRIFGGFLSSFQPVFSSFRSVERRGSKQTKCTSCGRLTTRVGVEVFLALSALLNLGVKMIAGPVKIPTLVSYFFLVSPILALPQEHRRNFFSAQEANP